MVAPAGAEPCPQITSGLPRFTSYRITGTSPPGPLRCGSTTCSVNAVAQAASKALPPRSKMLMPTAVAIQWVEVTTPNVPSISGRVVNGLGLILVMEGRLFYVVTLRQTRCIPSPIRNRIYPTLAVSGAQHWQARVGVGEGADR